MFRECSRRDSCPPLSRRALPAFEPQSHRDSPCRAQLLRLNCFPCISGLLGVLIVHSRTTQVLMCAAALTGLLAAQTVMEGTVHDATGNLISGVAITLQHRGQRVAQNTTTDSEGKFHFAAVEAGAYELKAEAAGYYPSTYNFTLRPRQPLALAVELPTKATVSEKVEVQPKCETIAPRKPGNTDPFTP